MIANLGLLRIDLPWNFRKNKTELILLPALAVTMTASLMAAAGLMLTTGLDYLGIGLWYPVFLALICVTAGIGTLAWDTLALPFDSKVLEYFITAGLTAIAIGINVTLTPTAYTAWAYVSGLLLVTIAWILCSYATWAASLSIPPPREDLLESPYGVSFIDYVIDGRVKREVGGRNRQQQMYAYCIVYTISSFIFALLFSLFWTQYRSAPPTPLMNSIISILIVIYIASSFFVVILSSLKSKEALLIGEKVRILGGGWQKHNSGLAMAAIVFGTLAVITPPNLSPIASSNLDGIGANFNTFMEMLTKHIFSWIGGRHRGNSDGIGSSGNGSSMGSMTVYGRSLLLDTSSEIFTLIMLGLALTAVGLSIRYFWKKIRATRDFGGNISFAIGFAYIALIVERFIYLVRVPIVLTEMLKGWLRTRLVEAVKKDYEEHKPPNALQWALRRFRKRLLRYLLPEDPSAMIIALYGKMMMMTAKGGLGRRPEMTANEYARYIKSRASAISPEVTELTESYTAIRYARRKASATMAERAIASFKTIQRRVYSGLAFSNNRGKRR